MRREEKDHMTTQAPARTTYGIDSAHSSAEFSVRHLMISTMKGRFRDVEGTIYMDDQEPTRSVVEATIRTASVDTGVQTRDDDLRSDNFFSADRFPTMTFRSTSVEKVDEDRFRITGDLTVRGVTRPVVLDTEFEGRATDPWGGERIGFAASTSINRGDFGLTYNAALETGGVLVGDKVKVTLNIEALKKLNG